MESISVRSRAGSDGVLHLDIPSPFSDTGVDVTVFLQPVENPPSNAWSPDFFAEVAGGWKGEPLVRDDQGQYEVRARL